MSRLTVVLALGTVAHTSVRQGAGPSGRRASNSRTERCTRSTAGSSLADSYHCSRYNLNTGQLTEAMFHAVIAIVRETLDRG